jgi:hypothetical protein
LKGEFGFITWASSINPENKPAVKWFKRQTSSPPLFGFNAAGFCQSYTHASAGWGRDTRSGTMREATGRLLRGNNLTILAVLKHQ